MSNLITGRVVSIVSGGPSRPHVAITSDAICRRPNSDAWIFKPAAILPVSARVTLSPPSTFIDVIGTEENEIRRKSPYQNKSLLVIEESASPSMTVAAQSRYFDAFNGGICAVRLTNGSQADKAAGIATAVSVDRLSDLFRCVETRGVEFLTDTIGGAPVSADYNRVAVGFNRYTPDAHGEILSQTALQSALASAESLRSIGREDDPMTAITSPKEALAAALMLTLWGAVERSPSASTGNPPGN